MIFLAIVETLLKSVIVPIDVMMPVMYRWTVMVRMMWMVGMMMLPPAAIVFGRFHIWFYLEQWRNFLLVLIQIDDIVLARVQVRTKQNVLLILAEMIDFRLRCYVIFFHHIAVLVVNRMGIWAMGFDDRLETVLLVGRVMNATNWTIWLENAVVTFDNAFTARFPLGFNITSMKVFYTIAERICGMILRSK